MAGLPWPFLTHSFIHSTDILYRYIQGLIGSEEPYPLGKDLIGGLRRSSMIRKKGRGNDQNLLYRKSFQCRLWISFVYISLLGIRLLYTFSGFGTSVLNIMRSGTKQTAPTRVCPRFHPGNISINRTVSHFMNSKI
jgi:hypothetical protein